MELIRTTAEQAKNILDSGKRKIKATKGKGTYYVESINLNNNTFLLTTRKGHALQQNCEDYTFYIVVLKGAKTVY